MLLLASLTKSKWILLAPCRETSEWSRSGNGDDNGGNETHAIKNGVNYCVCHKKCVPLQSKLK